MIGVPLSHEKREALLDFKTLHLHEQAAERKHMETVIDRARSDCQSDGQPNYAFIFSGSVCLKYYYLALRILL